MGLFHGKGYWALILGGSSGIGLATAQKLAAEGMHLYIVHRDRRKDLPIFEEAVDAMRAMGVAVTTFNENALLPEKRANVLEQFPPDQPIRLMLHAISRGNLKRLGQALPSQQDWPERVKSLHLDLKGDLGGIGEILGEEDFQRTISAMATSLYGWAQGLIQRGLFHSDARIIGLTSEGNQRAWPYYAAVSAAKATLESLVRSMAMEWAPLGIRTNVVQAGVTDTPSLRMIPGAQQLKDAALIRNPMGRLTQAEDVAKVIALLATDEAAWINGALIPVDGGERLG